jgi:hypothetical protein
MNSQRGQAVLISLQQEQVRTRFPKGGCHLSGALAQLGERLICIQEVIGSIPIGSTRMEEGCVLLAAWPLGTCFKIIHWMVLPRRGADSMWVGSSGG